MALAPRPGRIRGRLQRIAMAFNVLRGDRLDLPPAEDWEVGDRADCIVESPWVNAAGELVEDPGPGFAAIVRAVHIARGRDGALRPFLVFARWPTRSFDARFFRKLTPRADAAEAADAAFLDQLKQIPAPLAARLERTLP